MKRLLIPTGVFPKGAEVDAFLADALRKFPDGPSKDERVERESVYLDWLSDRLAEVAKVEHARLVHFELRAVLRGGVLCEGPDVVWHGELTIIDAAAFSSRLASGVGRHAAYGYGMLLLRPAR